MYDINTDEARYDGKFGTLNINFTNRTVEGDLDHQAIWQAAGEDPVTAQLLYEEIALETVDDGHEGKCFGFGWDRIDSGVVIENGDIALVFDSSGPVRFA